MTFPDRCHIIKVSEKKQRDALQAVFFLTRTRVDGMRFLPLYTRVFDFFYRKPQKAGNLLTLTWEIPIMNVCEIFQLGRCTLLTDLRAFVGRAYGLVRI